MAVVALPYTAGKGEGNAGCFHRRLCSLLEIPLLAHSELDGVLDLGFWELGYRHIRVVVLCTYRSPSLEN